MAVFIEHNRWDAPYLEQNLSFKKDAVARGVQAVLFEIKEDKK